MNTTAMFRFMKSRDSFLIRFDNPFPKLHEALVLHLDGASLADVLKQNYAGASNGELILLGYESRLRKDETNRKLISTLKNFCGEHQIVWKNEIIPQVKNDDSYE